MILIADKWTISVMLNHPMHQLYINIEDVESYRSY